MREQQVSSSDLRDERAIISSALTSTVVKPPVLLPHMFISPRFDLPCRSYRSRFLSFHTYEILGSTIASSSFVYPILLQCRAPVGSPNLDLFLCFPKLTMQASFLSRIGEREKVEGQKDIHTHIYIYNIKLHILF